MICIEFDCTGRERYVYDDCIGNRGIYSTYADVVVRNCISADLEYQNEFTFNLQTHHELVKWFEFSDTHDFLNDFEYTKSGTWELIEWQFEYDSRVIPSLGQRIIENAVKFIKEKER